MNNLDIAMSNSVIEKLCQHLTWQQFQKSYDSKSLHIRLDGTITYTDNDNKRISVNHFSKISNEVIAGFDDFDKEYFTFYQNYISKMDVPIGKKDQH